MRFSRAEIEAAMVKATKVKPKESGQNIYRRSRVIELSRAGKSVEDILWIAYGIYRPDSPEVRAMKSEHEARRNSPFASVNVNSTYEKYAQRKSKLEAEVKQIIEESNEQCTSD